MTRKHFVALADALKHNAPHPESQTYQAELTLFSRIVGDVARACAGANCRFDRGRFERASGLTAAQRPSS